MTRYGRHARIPERNPLQMLASFAWRVIVLGLVWVIIPTIAIGAVILVFVIGIISAVISKGVTKPDLF